MAEPASSAASAAGYAGFKALGGVTGIGAVLAAIVVMCMTKPRTGAEWAVGLISTVVCSIAGGAYAVIRLNLHHGIESMNEIDLFLHLTSGIGLVFACGLPGWALVRWGFNWIDKRRDRDLGEIVGEVRGLPRSGP